jgi:hypothetical protein
MITATNPQTYRLVSDHIFAVVRQNIDNNQKAFFAQRKYEAGQVVTEFSAGAVLSHPTYLTVQVDIDKHIMLQPEHLQYINHSCDPNVFFDTYTMQVVALKPIAEGDEMTFFYPSTEWDMAQPFKCHCGTSRCLGEIKGAAHINPQVLRSYTLTRFIQQQLHDRSSKEKRA